MKPGSPAPSIARFAIGALAAALLAQSVPAQSECDLGSVYGWQTTKWWVRCGPDVVSTLEMFDMLITSEVHVDVECNDGRTVGVSSVTRSELEAASEWLQSMCFRNPDVPLVVRPDPNRIVHAAWVSSVMQKQPGKADSLGVYVDGNLYVNFDSFFAMGANEIQMRRDLADTSTMVHELFHAIQAQYPLFYDDVPLWVLEGTAEAVALSWLERDGGSGALASQRHYDFPLQRPDPDREFDPYATYRWWLWLGKTLGAADWVAYLADLLKDADFSEHDGLVDLESWLESRGLGLFDLYPLFIAESVAHPGLFSDVHDETIRYRDDRTVEEEHEGRVREVAAEAVRLSAEVPSGESARLTIQIRPDQESLHLAVDKDNYSTPGESLEIDAGGNAVSRPGRSAGSGKARNRFRSAIVGGDEPLEFMVRVTNVGQDPVSTEATDYRLHFELEPFGICDFTASISGDTGATSASGRVAHFSTSGGTSSTGMMMNPGNAQGMAAMIEAMAGDQLSEEERAELRAGAEAWSREAAKLPTETLGIALMEMDPSGDAASQLAGALGGFRLNASVFDQPIEPGFRGALEPGLITVLTGDFDQDVTGQTRFAWAPGEPGSGSIRITDYSEDQLAGSINAVLEAQGVRDADTGERLRIQLSATFVARPHDPLRGELGCLTAD